jgi:hypothetical protein
MSTELPELPIENITQIFDTEAATVDILPSVVSTLRLPELPIEIVRHIRNYL